VRHRLILIGVGVLPDRVGVWHRERSSGSVWNFAMVRIFRISKVHSTDETTRWLAGNLNCTGRLNNWKNSFEKSWEDSIVSQFPASISRNLSCVMGIYKAFMTSIILSTSSPEDWTNLVKSTDSTSISKRIPVQTINQLGQRLDGHMVDPFPIELDIGVKKSWAPGLFLDPVKLMVISTIYNW
jgi:hypothetical protein